MWHRNLCIKGEIRRNIREKGSKDDSMCEIGVKSQIHLLLHFPYCVGVVFSHSHVWLFATPWTAACQTFLSFTVSHSLLKLMSIESVIEKEYYKDETSNYRKMSALHSLLFFTSVHCLKNSFANIWALTTTIKWL